MPVSSKHPFFSPKSKTEWLLALAAWTGGLMLVVGIFWVRFDLVIQGDGVVEAVVRTPAFAPRTARLAERWVEPGERVEAGQRLLRLHSPELEREISVLREQILAVDLELARAATRLGELELLGIGLEAQTAESSLTLHRRNEQVLEQIGEIYGKLAEGGFVSRLEQLRLEAERLREARGALRDEKWMELADQGYLELLRAQAGAEESAALRRGELLRERLQLLESEREALSLKAPVAGEVTNVWARDPGMAVAAGDLLLVVADPEGGYQARMFVSDRNVDLLRIGMPARLESMVFSSSAEGYMRGVVTSVVKDAGAAKAGGFEVVVSIVTSPAAPVIGSRVKAEIQLKRQGALDLLSNRSPRGEPE